MVIFEAHDDSVEKVRLLFWIKIFLSCPLASSLVTLSQYKGVSIAQGINVKCLWFSFLAFLHLFKGIEEDTWIDAKIFKGGPRGTCVLEIIFTPTSLFFTCGFPIRKIGGIKAYWRQGLHEEQCGTVNLRGIQNISITLVLLPL